MKDASETTIVDLAEAPLRHPPRADRAVDLSRTPTA
jgi:hypothetical protein